MSYDDPKVLSELLRLPHGRRDLVIEVVEWHGTRRASIRLASADSVSRPVDIGIRARELPDVIAALQQAAAMLR